MKALLHSRRSANEARCLIMDDSSLSSCGSANRNPRFAGVIGSVESEEGYEGGLSVFLGLDPEIPLEARKQILDQFELPILGFALLIVVPHHQAGVTPEMLDRKCFKRPCRTFVCLGRVPRRCSGLACRHRFPSEP